MISGVIMILVSFLTEAGTCLMVSLAVLVAAALTAAFYSCRIARKTEAE